MRVVVDQVQCEANGICEQWAPSVFRLDEQDTLQVLQPEPTGDDLVAAREAIDRCPRQALREEQG